MTEKSEIFDFLKKNTQIYDLAVIFGSYARGQEHSTSDIDLLVVDEQFSGWNLHPDNSNPLSFEWPQEFPELHLITCGHEEFEERFKQDEEMVSEIESEGFAINEDFKLVDYVSELKKRNSFY